MSKINSINLVTAPDDVLFNAKRILMVDLTIEQQNFVSNVLRDTTKDLVVYIWNLGDDFEWLIDKQLKSNATLVDLLSTEQLLTGYFLGYNNTYYFGDSKNIQKINKNAIYSAEQLLQIIEDQI